MDDNEQKNHSGMNRRDMLKAASATGAIIATGAAAITPKEAIAAEKPKSVSSAGAQAKLPIPYNNGGAAFLRNLAATGVDTLFGCPGTSEMQVVDEIGYSNLKVHLCLFENSVTAMADGYARMANKPALCLLHVGSGLTNSLANMHNARIANSRMIIFGGGVHYAFEANQPLHSMLQRPPQIAQAAADWIFEAFTPDQLAAAAGEAFQKANEGAGNICYVYGPNNAIWGDTALATDLIKCPARETVADSTIDELAEVLNGGKKAAFILDNLALQEEALELLGRIAEGTGGGLYRDWLVPRASAGAGRVKMDMLPPEATDSIALLSDYDLLVNVGISRPMSAAFSYEGLPWLRTPDGFPIKTLATADHDIIDALERLVDKINGAPATASNRHERDPGTPPTGVLSGVSIAQSLNNALPEDSIVIEAAFYENLFYVENTQGMARYDLLAGAAGGAIGDGPPLACGAAIAEPNRKVVLLIGDFSLMQGNTALWSMAQHNLDICVVNYNNQGSGSLASELARVRRGDVQAKSGELLDIRNPPIDYAAMAESMGVPATRAKTAEEFHKQFVAAMKSKGPHFIDADVLEGSVRPAIVAKMRENYEKRYIME
jgi:acetolactate synthase-1/2/3 large subunit